MRDLLTVIKSLASLPSRAPSGYSGHSLASPVKSRVHTRSSQPALSDKAFQSTVLSNWTDLHILLTAPATRPSTNVFTQLRAIEEKSGVATVSTSLSVAVRLTFVVALSPTCTSPPSTIIDHLLAVFLCLETSPRSFLRAIQSGPTLAVLLDGVTHPLLSPSCRLRIAEVLHMGKTSVKTKSIADCPEAKRALKQLAARLPCDNYHVTEVSLLNAREGILDGSVMIYKVLLLPY